MTKLKPFHHIRLDKEFKADCKIWLNFLKTSETSIFRPMIDFAVTTDVTVLDFYTDASGSLMDGGYGCAFEHRWSYGIWSQTFMREKKPSIEYLELAVLVFGIFMWTEELRDKRVQVFCDNTALVNMINKLTSSCKNCMFLLRKVVLKSLDSNFRIFARYVKSKENGIADSLSRQDWRRFKMLT